MRIALRSPIVLSFASRGGRALAFAGLAAIRAAVVSYFVFVAFFYPLQHLGGFQGPILWLARVLSFPIELLGFALPFLRSPVRFIGLPWSTGYGCFMDPAWALRTHMRAGVITYLLLFHLPTFFRIARGRLRRRSTQSPSAGERSRA